MKTTEESYIEYVCDVCKNKNSQDIEKCEIRRKIDGTMYCSGYDTTFEKKKVTPEKWQGW